MTLNFIIERIISFFANLCGDNECADDIYSLNNVDLSNINTRKSLMYSHDMFLKSLNDEESEDEFIAMVSEHIICCIFVDIVKSYKKILIDTTTNREFIKLLTLTIMDKHNFDELVVNSHINEIVDYYFIKANSELDKRGLRF